AALFPDHLVEMHVLANLPAELDVLAVLSNRLSLCADVLGPQRVFHLVKTETAKCRKNLERPFGAGDGENSLPEGFFECHFIRHRIRSHVVEYLFPYVAGTDLWMAQRPHVVVE